jgi:hypothetical protein
VESMTKSYNCPACGFLLDFEPWSNGSASDEICPCCGIQFGYTDFAGGDVKRRAELYHEWRNRWIAKGMPWHDPGNAPPPDWNPTKQLQEFLNS